MSSHLRPNAAPAPDAILPADPAVAMRLAQVLLTAPLMTNHARGLWGYAGVTESGLRLTIQSTGIGAASSAIVLAELAKLGVCRVVRLDAADPISSPPPWRAAAVASAIGADGVSRGGGQPRLHEPDPVLHAGLLASGLPATTALTSDLPGRNGETPRTGDAEVADLATASVYATALSAGVAAAAILTSGGGEGVEALAGEAAAAALQNSQAEVKG